MGGGGARKQLADNGIEWIDKVCFPRWAFVLNLSEQYGHWNGRIWSCTIREWRWRPSRKEKLAIHLSHLYGLSFSCTERIWIGRLVKRWARRIRKNDRITKLDMDVTYMFVKIGRSGETWSAMRANILCWWSVGFFKMCDERFFRAEPPCALSEVTNVMIGVRNQFGLSLNGMSCDRVIIMIQKVQNVNSIVVCWRHLVRARKKLSKFGEGK